MVKETINVEFLIDTHQSCGYIERIIAGFGGYMIRADRVRDLEKSEGGGE